MNVPWIVPWEIMLPAVTGLCCIVAVVAWTVGRWSLRRTFNRSVAIDAELKTERRSRQIAERELHKARAEAENYRRTLTMIESLIDRPVGDGFQIRAIK